MNIRSGVFRRGSFFLIVTVFFVFLFLVNSVYALSSEDALNIIESFNLDIPERVSPSRFVVNSDFYEDEYEVIVVLKNPESVSGWSRSVSVLSDDDKKSLNEAMKTLILDKVEQGFVGYEYNYFNGFFAKISSDELEHFLSDPFVKVVEENIVMTTLLSDSVEIIGADKVWDYSVDDINLTGEGEVVCVVDTGIDYEHPDLGGCYGNNDVSSKCKVIGGKNILDPGSSPMDNNGHGTHVAGIVSANGDVKGVAPDSKLFAVKVMEGETGTMNNILEGLEFCLNNVDTFNISVISVSLGSEILYSNFCDSSHQTFSQVINASFDKNVSVVVATGNDGNSNEISSPACIKKAVRVGSSTKEDGLAAHSNVWSKGVLLAPGTSILSTYLNNNYASASGTSMATPHVSGAVTILNQFLRKKGVSLNPENLTLLLNNTGFLIKDSRNYSRINLLNATDELIKEYDDILLDLNLSKSYLLYENDSLIINWSSSSFANYSSFIKVVHNSTQELIFSSSNSSGEIILFSSDNESIHDLNITGKYYVLFNASNNYFNNSLNVSFFVKKNPSFEVKINNVSFDNITVYSNIYNVSINKSSVDVDSLFFYLDGENVNEESLQVKNFNESKIYSLVINHSETDDFFNKTLIKTINVTNVSGLEIVNFSSSESFFDLSHNESFLFYVNVSDYLFSNISYYWFFANDSSNNLSVNNSLLFNASVFSPDNYDLMINISNNISVYNLSWTIRVLPEFYLWFENNISNKECFVNETFNINVSNYFFFGGNTTVFNFTNNNLSFVQDQNMLFVNCSVNASFVTKINASMITSDGSLFNESNYFNVSIKNPFLFFNDSLNITNKTITEGGSVVINLSGLFVYGGGVVSYNITEDLNFEIDNDLMTIFFPDSGEFFIRVNSSMNSLHNHSNEFMIKVNKQESSSSTPDSSLSEPVSEPASANMFPSFVEEEEIVYHKTFRNVKFNESEVLVLDVDFLNDVFDYFKNYSGRIYDFYGVDFYSNFSLLEFNISKFWLDNNNLSIDDIIIYYYQDEWKSIPVILKEEKDDGFVFEVFLEKADYFLIASEEPLRVESPVEIMVEEEKISVEESSEKNFSINLIILTAIIVFLIIVVVELEKLREHKKKEKDLKNELNENKNE